MSKDLNKFDFKLFIPLLLLVFQDCFIDNVFGLFLFIYMMIIFVILKLKTILHFNFLLSYLFIIMVFITKMIVYNYFLDFNIDYHWIIYKISFNIILIVSIILLGILGNYSLFKIKGGKSGL